MYTGIISGMCQVLAIEGGEEIRSFVIELAGHEDGLEIGASVALEGVCMTVVAIDDSQIRFESDASTDF
jgi:riboflavin synthase